MDSAGDNFFARAGLAGDQDRKTGAGDPADQLHDFNKCRAHADQINV